MQRVVSWSHECLANKREEKEDFIYLKFLGSQGLYKYLTQLCEKEQSHLFPRIRNTVSSMF